MDGRILLFLILWPCIGGVFCFIIGRKNSKVRNNVASVVTGIQRPPIQFKTLQCQLGNVRYA